MHARQRRNTGEAIAFMEEALKLLPQDNSWLRSLILLNLGVTYFVADNYGAAKRLLPEVSRIEQARGMADPAIALTVLVRNRQPAFGWTLVGTLCLAIAFPLIYFLRNE